MRREKNCQICDIEKNTKLRLVHGKTCYYCNKCYDVILKKIKKEIEIKKTYRQVFTFMYRYGIIY